MNINNDKMGNDNKMKITSLRQGDLFKTNAKQRKLRTFIKCVELQGDKIHKEHIGKILVIYDNCKQMVCSKESDVYVEINIF